MKTTKEFVMQYTLQKSRQTCKKSLLRKIALLHQERDRKKIHCFKKLSLGQFSAYDNHQSELRIRYDFSDLYSLLILPSKWGLFAKVLICLVLRNFSVEFIDRIETSSSTKPIIVPSSMKCAKNLLITSSCCNSHQVKLSSSSSNNQPIDTDSKNPIHQTSRQQIQIEPPFSTLSLSCKTHSSLLTSSVVKCC